MSRLRHYLASLPTGKLILWCYLIWYLVTLINHFDPSPAIWLNALGISAVVGFALLLSVGGAQASPPWQTFRLFLMPFCVSSFSTLIKGRGFILIAPPDLGELAMTLGACGLFVSIVLAAKRSGQKSTA